jgi:hypothetical protein
LILPSGLTSTPETDRFLIVLNEEMLARAADFSIGKHLLSCATPARDEKKDNASIVFDDYADKTPSTYLPRSEKNTRPI